MVRGKTYWAKISPVEGSSIGMLKSGQSRLGEKGGTLMDAQLAIPFRPLS